MTVEQRNHNPKVTGSTPVSGIDGNWEFAGRLQLHWTVSGSGESVPESPSEAGNDPRLDPKASESEVPAGAKTYKKKLLGRFHTEEEAIGAVSAFRAMRMPFSEDARAAHVQAAA